MQGWIETVKGESTGNVNTIVLNSVSENIMHFALEMGIGLI